ncbi:MAG TPA: pseudouridine synthase [Polyangiaceae bacterium]|nr:pseudouridine synthase [Polyangiaceae bacterium]
MADLELLYRDSDLVAVNKPSGLAVHRGWADDDAFAMTLLRDALGQWVYPVHRLDRGASGVLLFALSAAAARVICGRFEQHEVDKRYLALVRGAPPETVVVDHPLRPDNSDVPQPAVTEVVRLEQLGRYAWVEARPQSGRLHQIRRHLKHLSCPIIGDVKYGKGEHNRLFREHYGLHRLALHAARLELRGLHDEPIQIDAALPSELANALDLLRAQQSASSPSLPQ